MFSDKRREFLKQAATAGIAFSANTFLNPFAWSQPSPDSGDVARIYVDSRRTIAPLDRNLFGSFLEHLGRAIYTLSLIHISGCVVFWLFHRFRPRPSAPAIRYCPYWLPMLAIAA